MPGKDEMEEEDEFFPLLGKKRKSPKGKQGEGVAIFAI